MDQLLLDGIPFPVLTATFDDRGDGTITFSIQCGASPSLPAAHRLWGVEPRLYADGAELPLIVDGATARLAAAQLPERSIALYVYEHEDLASCTASFVTRGELVRIELQGQATIMGRPVTVAVNTEARARSTPEQRPVD
jgi:hypothetical protein